MQTTYARGPRRGHRRGIAAALLIGAVFAMVLSGCGSSTSLGSIAEARSEKERVVPDVAAEELAELVAGNSALAFELYRELSADDGNLFFSPYSISAALAMTYAGARGETEAEMAETLGFGLDQAVTHERFNALDLALKEQREALPGETGEPFELSIANAVWGQRDYAFLAPFLDTLAEHYGTGLQLLDFAADSEGARDTINAWVSEETQERIQDLLPPGVIDDLTRLVLTNAIYFNASWLFPFDKAATRDGTFYLLDGSEVETPMMRVGERIRYGEVDGVQAVRLPYAGFQYSTYVLVPPEGEFLEFESAISAERIDAVLGGLVDAHVELTMPSFEFESSFDLVETLTALGMPSTFEPRIADLSGMDGTRDLYISDVVHKAFVAVDEEGTEAAAATGVVGQVLSGPEVRAELVVDRPFLFLIRHEATGTLLFVGRVLDPTA